MFHNIVKKDMIEALLWKLNKHYKSPFYCIFQKTWGIIAIMHSSWNEQGMHRVLMGRFRLRYVMTLWISPWTVSAWWQRGSLYYFSQEFFFALNSSSMPVSIIPWFPFLSWQPVWILPYPSLSRTLLMMYHIFHRLCESWPFSAISHQVRFVIFVYQVHCQEDWPFEMVTGKTRSLPCWVRRCV